MSSPWAQANEQAAPRHGGYARAPLLGKNTRGPNRSMTLARRDFEKVLFESQAADALRWIRVSLEDEFVAVEHEKFGAQLQDGVYLNRMMSLIINEAIRYHKNPRSQLACLENIEIVIKRMREYGVKTLFEPLDLLEQKNLNLVAASIHALAQVSEQKGFFPVLIKTATVGRASPAEKKKRGFGSRWAPGSSAKKDGAEDGSDAAGECGQELGERDSSSAFVLGSARAGDAEGDASEDFRSEGSEEVSGGESCDANDETTEGTKADREEETQGDAEEEAQGDTHAETQGDALQEAQGDAQGDAKADAQERIQEEAQAKAQTGSQTKAQREIPDATPDVEQEDVSSDVQADASVGDGTSKGLPCREDVEPVADSAVSKDATDNASPVGGAEDGSKEGEDTAGQNRGNGHEPCDEAHVSKPSEKGEGEEGERMQEKVGTEQEEEQQQEEQKQQQRKGQQEEQQQEERQQEAEERTAQEEEESENQSCSAHEEEQTEEEQEVKKGDAADVVSEQEGDKEIAKVMHKDDISPPSNDAVTLSTAEGDALQSTAECSLGPSESEQQAPDAEVGHEADDTTKEIPATGTEDDTSAEKSGKEEDNVRSYSDEALRGGTENASNAAPVAEQEASGSSGRQASSTAPPEKADGVVGAAPVRSASFTWDARPSKKLARRYKYVRARYAYDPSAHDELKFERGDVIRIVEMPIEGYGKGILTVMISKDEIEESASGLVPMNYVTPISEAESRLFNSAALKRASSGGEAEGSVGSDKSPQAEPDSSAASIRGGAEEVVPAAEKPSTTEDGSQENAEDAQSKPAIDAHGPGGEVNASESSECVSDKGGSAPKDAPDAGEREGDDADGDDDDDLDGSCGENDVADGKAADSGVLRDNRPKKLSRKNQSKFLSFHRGMLRGGEDAQLLRKLQQLDDSERSDSTEADDTDGRQGDESCAAEDQPSECAPSGRAAEEESADPAEPGEGDEEQSIEECHAVAVGDGDAPGDGDTPGDSTESEEVPEGDGSTCDTDAQSEDNKLEQAAKDELGRVDTVVTQDEGSSSSEPTEATGEANAAAADEEEHREELQVEDNTENTPDCTESAPSEEGAGGEAIEQGAGDAPCGDGAQGPAPDVGDEVEAKQDEEVPEQDAVTGDTATPPDETSEDDGAAEEHRAVDAENCAAEEGVSEAMAPGHEASASESGEQPEADAAGDCSATAAETQGDQEVESSDASDWTSCDVGETARGSPMRDRSLSGARLRGSSEGEQVDLGSDTVSVPSEVSEEGNTDESKSPRDVAEDAGDTADSSADGEYEGDSTSSVAESAGIDHEQLLLLYKEERSKRKAAEAKASDLKKENARLRKLLQANNIPYKRKDRKKSSRKKASIPELSIDEGTKSPRRGTTRRKSPRKSPRSKKEGDAPAPKRRMPISDPRRQERQIRRSLHLTKLQQHRMQVIHEIYSTEETYVRDLQLMADLEGALTANGICTQEEASLVFLNAQQILTVQKQFLHDLDERLEATSDDECWNCSVGDVFQQLGLFLKIYSVYVAGQFEQTRVTEKLFKISKFVNMLLQDFTLGSNKQSVRNAWDSILIKPIQRICKYPLLIKELLKNTEDDHPDFPYLAEALRELQQVAADVNEKKRESEMRFQLLTIERRIVGLPPDFHLVIDGRELKKEARLVKVSKGRAQERYFFLFSDVLVYCKEALVGKSLEFKGMMKLDLILINDIGDSQFANSFELVRVDAKKKKYKICAPTAEVKEEWLEALQALSKQLMLAAQEEPELKNIREENLKMIRKQSQRLERMKAMVPESETARLLHFKSLVDLENDLKRLKKITYADSDTGVE